MNPPPRNLVAKIGFFGAGPARVLSLDGWQLTVEAPWDTKDVLSQAMPSCQESGLLCLCYLFCFF